MSGSESEGRPGGGRKAGRQGGSGAEEGGRGGAGKRSCSQQLGREAHFEGWWSREIGGQGLEGEVPRSDSFYRELSFLLATTLALQLLSETKKLRESFQGVHYDREQKGWGSLRAKNLSTMPHSQLRKISPLSTSLCTLIGSLA